MNQRFPIISIAPEFHDAFLARMRDTKNEEPWPTRARNCNRCRQRMIASIGGVCIACLRVEGHPGVTPAEQPRRPLRPAAAMTAPSKPAAATPRTYAGATTKSVELIEAEQRERTNAALAEAIRPMTAALDGQRAGEKFQGDPWFAARMLGIPVVAKDLSSQNAIGRFCWLNADPSSPWIELHEGLSPSKKDQTLAFELARHYGYRDDPLPNDDPCSLAFAKAFLDQSPQLVRMRAAAKYRDDALERGRAAARAASLARR